MKSTAVLNKSCSRSYQMNMSSDLSSPPQELALDEAGGRLGAVAQPAKTHIRIELSDDDMPVTARRRLDQPSKELPHNASQRERRSTRGNDREHGYYKDPELPKLTPKVHKKPGPAPWAAKPIMKNDMKAKKAVIREIEGYWGKGFIKAYVPKCHRPLVKRGGGKRVKRSNNRVHETDPKKWLPSVLKAILMIAKLTNNKTWLKDAMNDVVRHRIKHTGNRKPQLVTTDFDVIEDMLVKQWDVDYAFEIRYKHLLIHRKEVEDTEEDIDHILQVATDSEDGSEGGEDHGASDDSSEMDDGDVGKEEDDSDRGNGGISSKYLHKSGYTTDPLLTPPISRQQPAKQSKSSMPSNSARVKSEESESPPPGHHQNPYGAHPLMDPWGRPMPPYGPTGGYGGYSAYAGYGGYGGYGGFGPPQYPSDKGNRQPSHQPPPHFFPPPHHMNPGPPIPSPEPRTRRPKHTSSSPSHEATADNPVNPYASRLAERKIKRESLDLESGEEWGGDGGNQDEDEEIDAEMEAARLELKIARLKAKKAQRKGR